MIQVLEKNKTNTWIFLDKTIQKNLTLFRKWYKIKL